MRHPKQELAREGCGRTRADYIQITDRNPKSRSADHLAEEQVCVPKQQLVQQPCHLTRVPLQPAAARRIASLPRAGRRAPARLPQQRGARARGGAGDVRRVSRVKVQGEGGVPVWVAVAAAWVT